MQRSTISGLAVRFDFKGLTQQNNEQEELDRKAKLDAENKSKYWADKLKPGKVFTEYGRKQLQIHNEEVATKLGALINNNRNWETNPTILAQVNALTDSLSDNDITAKELRIEQGRQQMAKDLASGEWTPADFDEATAKYQAYSKTGRTTGNVDHPEDEFIYQSPVKFDMSAYAGGLAAQMKGRDHISQQNGMIVTKNYVEDEQVSAKARAAIAGSEGHKIARAYKKLVEQGDSEFSSLQDFVEKSIRANLGTDTQFKDIPVTKTSADGSEKQVNFIDPYKEYMLPVLNPSQKAGGYVKGAHIFGGFSPDGKSFNAGENGVYVRCNNGVIKNLIQFKNETMEAAVPNGTDKIYKGKTGASYLVAPTRIPLNEKSLHDMFNDYDYQKEGGAIPGDELHPDYKGKVKYELNGKGERTGYVIVETAIPLHAASVTEQQMVDFSAIYQSPTVNQSYQQMKALQKSIVDNGNGTISVYDQVKGQWVIQKKQ